MTFSPAIRRAWTKYNDEGPIALIKDARIPPPPRIKIQLKRHYLRIRGHPGIGDPFRVYQVPPDQVQYSVTSSMLDDRKPKFGIIDGEWDKRVKEIPDADKVVRRFRDGFDWDEIDTFQNGLQRIKDGEFHGHLDIEAAALSVDDWYEYHRYLDDLFERMREEGYKSQRELTPADEYLQR